MKPIIGVTSSIREEKALTTSLNNIHAIVKAGGIPVVLPNFTDESLVDQVISTLDGLLATGGVDIDPTLFGEEPHPSLGEVTPDRDTFELMAVSKFMALDKPVLGICRGCQVINVSAGGGLYQDIYAQHETQLLQHSQKAPTTHPSHYVEVAEDSRLHQIVQTTRFKVNSFHHQAVKNVTTDFKVSAKASDGIIEAFESTKHRFVLGIQWHPETMVPADDIYSQKIFAAFIQACLDKV